MCRGVSVLSQNCRSETGAPRAPDHVSKRSKQNSRNLSFEAREKTRAGKYLGAYRYSETMIARAQGQGLASTYSLDYSRRAVARARRDERGGTSAEGRARWDEHGGTSAVRLLRLAAASTAAGCGCGCGCCGCGCGCGCCGCCGYCGCYGSLLPICPPRRRSAGARMAQVQVRT